MNQAVLITGVNGFVGHHLARTLKDQGVDIVGIGHDSQAAKDVAPLLAAYISADLTDKSAVEKIELSNITAVIHLAGLANVGQSFAEPAHFLAANTAMSIHLLQKALDTKSETRFIVISSGAVYESKQTLPITENGQLTHGTPYAVSKLAVENMNDYYRSLGVNVVTMRPFNHIGPGQGPGFIVPDLLGKLQAYRDAQTPVSVGNLQTARDYTDVRDVARAYTLVALSTETPKHPVYNVCSGRSLKGIEIYEGLAKDLGLSPVPEPQVDQAALRPNDAVDLYGDNSRIKGEFGWQPEITLDQTLADIIANGDA